MDDVKVFKMNDCEWFATNLNLDDLYKWYLKEYGLEPEDNPFDEIIECDLDNEGMWWYLECDTDEHQMALFREFIQNASIEERKNQCYKKGQIGEIKWFNCCGAWGKKISFRDAIKLNGYFTEPYCIACSEY